MVTFFNINSIGINLNCDILNIFLGHLCCKLQLCPIEIGWGYTPLGTVYRLFILLMCHTGMKPSFKRDQFNFCANSNVLYSSYQRSRLQKYFFLSGGEERFLQLPLTISLVLSMVFNQTIKFIRIQIFKAILQQSSEILLKI